jgi:dipeptidase
VAHLTPEDHTYWATGTSAPCTGIFKPLWFGASTEVDLDAAPGGRYDPDTLWWRHEQLHRLVLRDYQHRLERYRAQRDHLEQTFLEQARNAKPADRGNVSRDCFRAVREATREWIEQVRTTPPRRESKWSYRWYWSRQNRKAGIEA